LELDIGELTTEGESKSSIISSEFGFSGGMEFDMVLVSGN
jgi:hypothetical protein